MNSPNYKWKEIQENTDKYSPFLGSEGIKRCNRLWTFSPEDEKSKTKHLLAMLWSLKHLVVRFTWHQLSTSSLDVCFIASTFKSPQNGWQFHYRMASLVELWITDHKNISYSLKDRLNTFFFFYFLSALLFSATYTRGWVGERWWKEIKPGWRAKSLQYPTHTNKLLSQL